MKQPDYIDRIEPDPDGLDFDALRKAGIAMLQALSGEKWTDYNLHDPGVTILEQLCYALTDLAYRSEFAPEDYLAGPFGKIDFARHALHRADAILPSQVLTADDYRKIIYDAIPEVEDVWLTLDDPDLDGNYAGLYRISVQVRESLENDLDGDEQARLAARVKQRVVDVFNQHRNLGEDIREVVVIGTQPVFLLGDIQIHSLRDPAEIFADIYFRCAQQMVSGFRVERFVDAHASGTPLETMLSGPLTVHGRVVDTRADAPGSAIPIVRLVSVVQAVDGVTQVQHLALCDENGQRVQSDSVGGTAWRLRFPEKAQSAFLRLHFASGAVAHYQTPTSAQSTHLQTAKAQVILDDARVALRKVRFEFDAVRNTPQPLEQVVPAPDGVQRPLREYYSIQHQFPAIYGINRDGVPSSAPLKHKVSAHQLKAYLFLAEQLMANYLENLQAIPQVFSIDDVQQTYFSQMLDNRALPDIENLYVDTPAPIGVMLARIVARIDKPEDRRSRLIDVLLAMYGEQFSQSSLRRFIDYEDRHAMRSVVDNKLTFLRHIATLTRDRATAFDYTKGTTRDDGRLNLAGICAKIAILLGLPPMPSHRELSHRLRHYQLRPSAADNLSAADYARVAAHLTQLAEQDEAAPEHFTSTREILPASLLTQGALLENYILEQHGDEAHVHFQTHDARLGLVKLASYAEQGEADRYVRHLRSFICRLNMESEGFYLVEHLLLRPREIGDGDNASDAKVAQINAEFYKSRVSLVFPGWSARFSDPDFRSLAQETVCRNLPAHLYPECHWLDFAAMRYFEHRHRIWLDALRRYAGGEGPHKLNASSVRLAKFLARRRGVATRTYWV
jgi:hypothetical protein